MDTLECFIADLSVATIETTVNPYACHVPAHDRPGGAVIRRENLLRHLVGRHQPALLLVGEAPSYRGCRFSGIAFTSERRLVPPFAWSSTLPRGWTEPSATIVHRVLNALEIEDRTMLWNIVPTHPSGDWPLSNRTPTRAEINAGVEWLDRLIALVEPDVVVAIGKSAASKLQAGRRSAIQRTVERDSSRISWRRSSPTSRAAPSPRAPRSAVQRAPGEGVGIGRRLRRRLKARDEPPFWRELRLVSYDSRYGWLGLISRFRKLPFESA